MAEYTKNIDSFKYVVVNSRNQYLCEFPSTSNGMVGDWDIDILRAIRMDRIHAQCTAANLSTAVAVRILVTTVIKVEEYSDQQRLSL